jgi:hypothetical protein
MGFLRLERQWSTGALPMQRQALSRRTRGSMM